jgi:hypothetical protein
MNGGNGGLTVVMEIPFQREANFGIAQQSNEKSTNKSLDR